MPEIPAPIDPNGTVVVSVGTALWLVALVVALALHSRLQAAGHLWWIGACAAGFALGLVGMGYCRRRRTRLAASPRS